MGMLFAELFSLVNTNSDKELSIKKNELEFNNNFIKDSNTKTIEISKISYDKTENVAKSLAEIFYKELGIDLTDKFSSLEVKKMAVIISSWLIKKKMQFLMFQNQ